MSVYINKKYVILNMFMSLAGALYVQLFDNKKCGVKCNITEIS